MGATLDYSSTAASNTTVGGVSVAEGMTPGSVNNAMRAMMADSRKWQLDWSGVTTAGSSNAYTMTCNQGIAAYADGMRFSFRADRNNTGAATLNIDARGAKALRKVVGGALTALIADDIVAKAIYDVVFITADDVFVIVGSMSLTALGLTATAAELNYVDGVTSAIQTQLNAKQAQDALLDDIAALTDPGANKTLGWDDTANEIAWFDPNYTWTSATTSGAATYDVSSIPSWASDIVCTFYQVSLTTKTDVNTLQIGTGGSPAATGYDGNTVQLFDGTAITCTNATTSFVIGSSLGNVSGAIRLLKRAGADEWVAQGSVRRVSSGGAQGINTIAGVITLGGALDIVRLVRSGAGNYNGGTFAVGYK